jgi:hypothetical protein
VIARAWLWFFWPVYVVVALAEAIAVGIATHFVVEDVLKTRDQGAALSIDERFERDDVRCGIANAFALPALLLAIAACVFFAFVIRKYFVPRWFAAH